MILGYGTRIELIAGTGDPYREKLRVARETKTIKTPTPHPDRIVGFFLGQILKD